jgi:hypothetical protein
VTPPDTGHSAQFLEGRRVDVDSWLLLLLRDLETEQPDQELPVSRPTACGDGRAEREHKGDNDNAAGRDDGRPIRRMVHAALQRETLPRRLYTLDGGRGGPTTSACEAGDG